MMSCIGFRRSSYPPMPKLSAILLISAALRESAFEGPSAEQLDLSRSLDNLLSGSNMPNDSRGHRPSLPAPSRTDTQTTAVDPSFSSRPAANSSSLDGGMELSRITSSRLGTAEAMLAGHDEEELERIGASESQREKSRACAKEEEGNASSADEWTYPDGGLKAWTTVLVSSLHILLHCSSAGA